MKKFKFVGRNGNVEYLEIDHVNGTYTNDFYKYNGGNDSNVEMVKLKEIKRLTNWAKNVLEYKEI